MSNRRVWDLYVFMTDSLYPEFGMRTISQFTALSPKDQVTFVDYLVMKRSVDPVSRPSVDELIRQLPFKLEEMRPLLPAARFAILQTERKSLLGRIAEGIRVSGEMPELRRPGQSPVIRESARFG